MKNFVSKYRWPLGIVGGLLVGICVNMFMLDRAVNSFSGLVTKKSPYLDSLSYQEVIDAQENLLREKWSIEPLDQGQKFGFKITGADKEPLKTNTVSMKLLRPDRKAGDQEVTLEQSQSNPTLFISPVETPAKGLWMVEISFSQDKKNYLWKSQILL